MLISPDKLNNFVLRTKTVTNRCYVNRQINVFIINKYQTVVDQSVTDRLLIMYSVLLQLLFFVVAVVYSGSRDFYMADVNNFLLVN